MLHTTSPEELCFRIKFWLQIIHKWLLPLLVIYNRVSQSQNSLKLTKISVLLTSAEDCLNLGFDSCLEKRFSWEVAIVPAAHPAQSFNHDKEEV